MCDCPIDWVVCFNRDCERAKRLREIFDESHRKALEFIGDPSKVFIYNANTKIGDLS